MHPTQAALQSQSVNISYQHVKEGLFISVRSGTCLVNNVMIPLFVRVWFQHVLLYCTVVDPFATASLPPYLCSLHALEIQVIPLACSGDVTRALLPATRTEKRPKGFTYSTLVLGESGVYRSTHQDWVREVDDVREEEFCEMKNELVFVLCMR